MSADTLMAWHAQTLSRVPQRDGGRACCLRRGLLFGAAFANSCRAWPLPIEVLQCLSFSLPCSAGVSCVVRHPGPFASQDSLSSKKKQKTPGHTRGCARTWTETRPQGRFKASHDPVRSPAVTRRDRRSNGGGPRTDYGRRDVTLYTYCRTRGCAVRSQDDEYPSSESDATKVSILDSL